MENNTGKRKALVITTIVCVSLLVGILGSYAFFVSTGSNNKSENVSVETGDMVLVFEDGTDSFQGSLNFGDSATKSFTIENTGSLDAVAKMSFDKLYNSYILGSLTYTLSYSETEDGTYKELVKDKNVPQSDSSITRTLANDIRVPANTKYYYKLTITLNYLDDVDQTSDLKAMLSTNFILGEGETYSQETLKTLGITPNKKQENAPNFANTATTDEGVFEMEDDYGASYYFRGAVTNNYVKFAGFWWRIIRVNGDGSLRMIYDGTQAYANGTNNTNRLVLTSTTWHPQSNDAKYVGYMFGPTETTASTSKEQAQTNIADSNMKTQLESWYKTNIVDKGLDQYVSDEIFCNDRSIPGREATNWTSDTGLGYGTNVTGYGTVAREGWSGTSHYDNPQPQFTCPNKNDAFTKCDTEKGNGALNQKVGLITADEIVAAGSGKYGISNSSYYLYKGSWYWSLSPSGMDPYRNAYMFSVDSNGSLGSYIVGSTGGAAPVISLSQDYVSQMEGDGTIGNEYRVE